MSDSKGAYGRVEQHDEETAGGTTAGEETIMVTATPVPQEGVIHTNGGAVVADNNNGGLEAATAAAVPMIEIVAPATLMEGYELETQVGDQLMKVTIPPGGVEKGQKFQVPLHTHNQRAQDKGRAPVGHWKDGLFDCFRFGICHVSCWNSWCCPGLAAGQVIHRLGLNWMGFATESQAEKAQAFRMLQMITFVHIILYVLGIPFVRLLYFLLSFAIVMSVRSYIRNKYAIPEHGSCPKGTEDCCVSFWCLCCTVSQMMRHTANYETYAASCCTENGMSPTVPAVTV